MVSFWINLVNNKQKYEKTMKKKYYVTLEILGVERVFNYPDFIPVPLRDDVIIYENYTCIVTGIRHIISGDFIEIKILAIKS